MPPARRTPLVLALLAGCATPDPSPAARAEQPGEITHADADPSSQPAPAPEPATDPFVEGFVAAHNRERARVSPTAEPGLPPVRWSPELAATATAWAQRCVFEHSRTDYGENLSVRTDMAEPAEVVAAWTAEAANYDYRRNRCQSGEVCGHYTQVVWRNTTAIGCGVAQCNGGGPFGGGTWFIWVCNYDPPGNWKGEKPY